MPAVGKTVLACSLTDFEICDERGSSERRESSVDKNEPERSMSSYSFSSSRGEQNLPRRVADGLEGLRTVSCVPSMPYS